MTRNVKSLGQVFTPPVVVDQMLALRRAKGRTLEPSAGNGAFSSRIPGCVAIEFDPKVAPQGAKVMDFFAYPTTEQFDCVIGNPPYVRYQDIQVETKQLLNGGMFDGRSNLYLFFIQKCVEHLRPGGELIFITPRDFIKLTAAKHLNAWLFRQGTITDFFETGDTAIFGPYVPNCAIWRFEKNLSDRVMSDGRIFRESHGQLAFVRGDYLVPLSGLFDVKVGAVSGADEVFVHPNGNEQFVCSTTIDTGEARRAFFGIRNGYLENFKERLLARRIRHFDETNWWMWGRIHHLSDRPRVYVNCKTRRTAPFFTHKCKNYDGSILALFPKNPTMDLDLAVHMLNTRVNWHELGFVCDGRFIFSQRSLETCYLPDAFNRLRAPHLAESGPDSASVRSGSPSRQAA